MLGSQDQKSGKAQRDTITPQLHAPDNHPTPMQRPPQSQHKTFPEMDTNDEIPF